MELESVQRIGQDKAGAMGKYQTTTDLEGLDRSSWFLEARVTDSC